jgi:hypothetical protein
MATPELEAPDRQDNTPETEGSYDDYKYASVRIKKLIDDWGPIVKETERLRALRYLKVDVEALKKENLFKEDMVYVGVRLMDTNIRQENPQDIAYLTQTRRSLVLEPKNGVKVDGVETAEQTFTDACRYIGWQSPFLRVIDGAKHHGWDTVEVVLDVSKPGHFSNEHVGHENLIFDIEAEDLNNQELVLRKVRFTSIQLRQNVKKFGFVKEQVGKILASKSDTSENQSKDVQYEVYKCYYRDADNYIHIGWYHDKCDDWLKEPEDFYLGINELSIEPELDPLTGDVLKDRPKVKETEFPFYLLPYYESENDRISDVRGRGFLDEPAQAGASAIMSSAVNATVRASEPYASPENNPGDTNTGDIKQIAVTIKPGVWNKKLNFWNFPFPPSHITQIYQAIVTQNKAETAKVDFAALNKKDSRQTATHVQAAKEEANELTSVQVTLLSIFIQLVYSRNFRIFVNRVLQGKITIEDESLIELFKIPYNIKSSGDVDVIQRNEKIQRMQVAWPVMQNTPAAMPFLKNFIRTAFPEDAKEYIAAIDSGTAQGVNLVKALATIVQSLVVGEDGKLLPHAQPYAKELGNLLVQVQTYLQSQAAGQGGAQQQNGQQEPKVIDFPAADSDGKQMGAS